MVEPLLVDAPVVDLSIVGRITATSVRGFSEPLRRCVAEGRPFRALFDRRAVSAPTAEGREALSALYLEWADVAELVVAWADVYDPRRAASLERARQTRAERGSPRPGPPYPHRVFDDLDLARRWLEQDAAPIAPRALVAAR